MFDNQPKSIRHRIVSGRQIALLAGMMALTVPLAGQGGDMWQEVDDLNEAKDFDGAYLALSALQEDHSGEAGYLWRMARHHYNKSDNTTDVVTIAQEIHTGFNYAQKALSTDPASADAHGWYGIMIGRVGELKGTKQKIENSYLVRDHTLKAIELDPDADAWHHVMGRWHYTIADLNWFERTIASIVYATPPAASFKEAELFFKRATELDPLEIRHWLWLGQTQLKLGKSVEARKSLHYAIDLPAKSVSDALLQKRANELLN